MREKDLDSSILQKFAVEIEKELESEISKLLEKSKGMTLSQMEVEVMKIKRVFGERLMEKVLEQERGGILKKKTVHNAKDA